MANRTIRTPEKEKRFLNSLRKYGNVSKAARAAGVGRRTAYEWREEDKAFAAAWDGALEEATDALELEARRRAHEGVERVKVFHGQIIMVPKLDRKGNPIVDQRTGEPVMVPLTEHEYSDTLLIFLLKAHRPEKFRDRVDVTSGDQPLKALAVEREKIAIMTTEEKERLYRELVSGA
jgi:hypothetical protein